MRVTVTGIEERRAAPFAPGPGAGSHPIALPLPAAVLGAPNRGVRAWVERRGPLQTDLDWERIGDAVELARIDEDELMRVWSGDVPLVVPLPERRPGTDPSGEPSSFRLVITEWERLPVDEPFGDGGDADRVVYLDRFPL